jgi:hypothetical protein
MCPHIFPVCLTLFKHYYLQPGEKEMEYPACANGRCKYNDEQLCKADGIFEDIICEQGKAEACEEGSQLNNSMTPRIST